MIQFKDETNTLRTVREIKFRDESNVSRSVAAIYFRDASNTLRTAWQKFTASASPTSVEGYGQSAGLMNIVTTATTVTVVGGSAPYTYSWTTAAAGWAALYPTAKDTAFRSPPLGSGSSSSASFTLTITDASGVTFTLNVSAYAENLGP